MSTCAIALPIVSNNRRGRVLRWLAPDLALTFALVTLLALFFLFHGATTLLGDSDTGWHIRNGERILATGALPHVDPYSFSKPGEAWVSWEWGADVLMGEVHRMGGLAGVTVMYGLLIAASIWMWFRLNRAVAGNLVIACLLFIPMVSTTGIHWLARPHVLSWLFLLGAVWVCERLPRRLTWRHLTAVAAGAALWSNLHASFFFALLIAVIYAAGDWLGPLVWEDFDRHRARDYLWLAGASLAGTLINPNGLRLHQHVIQYLSNSALLDQISEFQSFNFHQDGGARVIFAIAACFAGAFAALAVRRPARFLLSILLTAMALRSVRVLPVAALLVLPLANASLTELLSAVTAFAPGFRRGLRAALDYGARLQEIDRGFNGFALVPVAVLLVFFFIRNSASFPAEVFPVAAASAVDSLPSDSRILTPDTFGGYLIYRFDGKRKVFFDGRSDYYGTEFLDRYLSLVSIRPGWQREFNRWNFSHALLPKDCSLVTALETSGWQEIYRDGTAVLLSGKPQL